MLIRVNAIDGMKENDLQSINSLNHYIGMRPIEAQRIPELRYMPWIVAGLIVTGVLVAIVGRRRLLVAWVASFAALGLAGLYDFWRWGYDYGHNLDVENAIIAVPGMTYQPPVIGTKQLLNFTATSWPHVGGVLAGVAFALACAALVVAYRRRPDARPSVASARCLARMRGEPASHPRRHRCLRRVSHARQRRSVRRNRRHGHREVTGLRLDRVHGRNTSPAFPRAKCATRGSSTRTCRERSFKLDDASVVRDRRSVLPWAPCIRWRRMRKDRVLRMFALPLRAAWRRARTADLHGISDDRPIDRRDASAARIRATASCLARGIYREPTIVVDKPLTISGEQGAVLDGASATHILRIEADDVTVRGLTFRNVAPSHVEDRAAIRAGASSSLPY